MPPRVLARIFQPVPPKSHPSCASPHSSEAASRKSRRFRAVFGGQGVLVRHTSTRGTQSTRAGKRETQSWRAATHPHGVRRRAREGSSGGTHVTKGLLARKSPGVLSPTSTPPKSVNATPKRDLRCPVSAGNRDPIFWCQVFGSWQDMPRAGPDHQEPTVWLNIDGKVTCPLSVSCYCD